MAMTVWNNLGLQRWDHKVLSHGQSRQVRRQDRAHEMSWEDCKDGLSNFAQVSSVLLGPMLPASSLDI